MKISEVLWFAANENLSEDGFDTYLKDYYSCIAIMVACRPELRGCTYTESKESVDSAEDFVVELGCDPSNGHAFDEFLEGPERQGARYLWLDFARLVAESEGL